MNYQPMINKTAIVDRVIYNIALMLGALSVAWTASIFAATNSLAFTVTVVIGSVYAIGAVELLRFGRATSTLSQALNTTQEKVDRFDVWLDRLDPSLRNAVRLRIEGERVGLPAPVLTPYLVGLLVMLGLLGTFVGMVDTLRGAVTALEGTTDLEVIRHGLTAPISGLGLAFGTSVAGVATSAMLGLMSTLNRRRRMLETQRLDTRIPIFFQDFCLAHSQRETFRALQLQTRSIPAVAGLLETVAGKLDRLGNAMMDNQDRFHRSVVGQYTKLATSMDRALKENLNANVRLVGDAIEPVVKNAMDAITQETQRVHSCLIGNSREAVEAFSRQLNRQSQDLAASWMDSAVAHQQTSDALITRLGAVLDGFSRQFDQSAVSMLDAFNETATAWIARQASSDTDRIARWTGCIDTVGQQATARLTDVSASVAAEFRQVADGYRSSFDATARDFLDVSSSLATTWQQTGEATHARQEELTASMAQAVDALTRRIQETATCMQTEMTRLTESSANLIASRRDAEATWIDGHTARMDELAQAVGEQLGRLRDDEDRRGRAAVARLENLESTLASHLTTLGKALEAPLTQMIETASEAPRAAASLVEQMRRETARQVHRDNRLLDERRRIMDELDTLSGALSENVAGQREAIDRLVASSRGMMDDVGRRFADQVDKELSNLSDSADTFAVSAVEMASLGESFSKAVELLNTSNSELVDNLSRIEAALDKTASRSDDQLGYFVAQAREIIDHSMLSQKEIFEELRQLRPKNDMDLEAN